MLFFETSRICDRVALLLESYSPYNTAEKEGWKVPYETLSVVASLSSQYSILFLCCGQDQTRLHVSTVSTAGVAHHGVSAAQILLNIKEFMKLHCSKRKGGFSFFSTMWSRKLSWDSIISSHQALKAVLSTSRLKKNFLLFFAHENGLGHMFQKQFSCCPILFFCVATSQK